MEFILPQPKELVAAVLLAVFVLFYFERYVHLLEHRLRLKKIHTMLVGFVVVFPLIFAHWQTEDWLVVFFQFVSYFLVVGVGFLLGVISAPGGNNSKV